MVDNLTSLTALVAGRIFKIPDYQRGYAWGDDERRDLLDDLEEIRTLTANSEYEHFTGTIVVEDTHQPARIPGGSRSVLEIVDGQQRITTLVILIRQIIDDYEKSKQPDYIQAGRRLKETFVKITENGPYLLELNADVNRFFIDSILEADTSPRPTLFPEDNLLAAKTQFRLYLDEKKRVLNDAYFEFLDSLVSIITTSLKFLVYQPKGQAEACFMFESMNARGLPLTQLEKTKNLLFFLAYKYRADENQLTHLTRAINDTWRQVWSDLYVAKSREEDQFLRFHWTVFEGEAWMNKDSPVKTSDIHEAIKKTIKFRIPRDNSVCDWLSNYLASMRIYSKVYRDLMNPRHDQSFRNFPDHRDQLIQLVESIQRIGRETNLVPILMAAYSRFADKPGDVEEIFRLVEVLVFRLVTVDRRSDTGRSAAFDTARRIGRREIDASAAISEVRALIEKYCGDTAFSAALGDQGDFYHWQGIRYFLFEYERYLKRRTPFLLDWDAFQRAEVDQSIEHILPQGDDTTTSEPWASYWSLYFSEDEWRAYRHCLGNLNLAMPRWNSSYSNRSFPDKRGDNESEPSQMVYVRSPWTCEQELGAVENWSPEQIGLRQKRLASWALKRWPVALDD